MIRRSFGLVVVPVVLGVLAAVAAGCSSSSTGGGTGVDGSAGSGSESGSGSGSSGGSGPYSCTISSGSAADSCIDFSSSYDEGTAKAVCTTSGGTFVSAAKCPTAKRLGSCTTKNGVQTTRYYTGYAGGVAVAKSACSGLGATWTSG